MLKTFLILLFIVLIAIWTLLFYKNYKNNQFTISSPTPNLSSSSEAQNSGILIGKIVLVNSNEFTLNDGQKNIKIMVNADTIYQKNLTDPLETRVGNASFGDIVLGAQAEVRFSPDSSGVNLIAKQINIVSKNIIVGIIKSISSDKMVVEDRLENKTYDIVLDSQTAYYQQIVTTALPQVNSESESKPEQIVLSDIKTGDSVSVFLNQGINVSPLAANKIVINKEK